MIEIRYEKLGNLTPYEKNSRVHSDEQISQICKSIKEFGFINPILIDSNGVVVAGHGRLLAARKLNLTEVPCINVGTLTKQQRQSLTIADNKIPMNAAWDVHLLKIELEDLQSTGSNLELLGFTEAELSEIFSGEEDGGASSSDEVETPSESGDYTSQLGDLWILGSHRLLCGSATSTQDFKTLMAGELASLVFTDPPYGITYIGSGEGEGTYEHIKNDELRQDGLCRELLIPAFKNLAQASRDDAAFYIWHAYKTRGDFVFSMEIAGIVERQYIIWIKPNFVVGNQDYHQATEPCFYASKGGVSPRYYADRTQDTAWRVTFSDNTTTATTIGGGLMLLDGEGSKFYVRTKAPKGAKVRNIRIAKGKSVVLFGESSNSTAWEIAKDSSDYIHPTQKPTELAERAINNSSQPCEIVLDCFCGSGSTLIAAEKLSRKCFAMELDPKYVDAIIHRWELLTGKSAILESSGKTFAEISRERETHGT